MIRLALIFPVLCFVLFGAHLLFHGWGLEIALLPLIPVVLLFVRHRYCAVICGMLLVCAGFEWLYTAIDLALTRQAYGMALGACNGHYRHVCRRDLACGSHALLA